VAVVAAASVLELVLGGTASALGIGLSAFLMGAVVALLVVIDEVRRDVHRRPGAASF
jgi:hypothetical protein